MKGKPVSSLDPLEKSGIEPGSKEHELHGKKSRGTESKQQILFLSGKKISRRVAMAGVGQIADRSDCIQNVLEADFFTIPDDDRFVCGIVYPDRNNTVKLH